MQTHQNRRRRLLAATTAIILGCVLAACGGSSGGGSGDENALKVGVPPSTTSLTVYAAEDLGYFDDEGLEVTTRDFTSGAAIVPEILRGDLQISVADTVGTVIAVSNDVPLRLFAGIQFGAVDPAKDYTGIVVPKGSRITEPADLEGATLAVNSIGGIAEVFARASMDAAGVDSSTVKFVELPPTAMVDSAKAGDVDGIVAVEPIIAAAKAAGMTVVLPASGVAKDAAVGTFMTSAAYAEKNGSTLQAFQKAVIKAGTYLNAHPDYARDLVEEKLGFDHALAQAIALPVYAESALTTDQLRPLIDFVDDYDLLASDVTADDVYLHVE